MGSPLLSFVHLTPIPPTPAAMLVQSFDSLKGSSTLLASLTFSNAAVLPRTVLSSVGQFETTALREVLPHENGLFLSNRPNIDTWGIPLEDDGLAQDSDRWTATKRRAPKRAEIGREVSSKASPLKDRQNKPGVGGEQNRDDAGRCLRAAQKLLEIYPLPRASEHVEALHSQWLGIIDSISGLEETLRQPLTRTGPEVQHDESYYRLLSLEDEIKREDLELLALQQFKMDRAAELAALKPVPVRRPGPAARKVPSVVARGKSTHSALPPPPRDREQVQTRRRSTAIDALESLPRARRSNSPPRPPTTQTEQEQDDSAPRRARPSISSTSSVLQRTTPNHQSSAPEVESKTAGIEETTSSSTSAEKPTERVGLPEGVTEEELEHMAKSVWRVMGDVLRPWARKWAHDRDLDRNFEDDGLNANETLQTVQSILSTSFPSAPDSPSSSSVNSYATSQAGGDGSELTSPPPSVLVELKLLQILLANFSSTAPPSSPSSLPTLTVILRDPPVDASTTIRSAKTPCLQMNALKAHLGAFAVERGWTEGMGTTAIYALISKQIARIDRRGREGAAVGFK